MNRNAARAVEPERPPRAAELTMPVFRQASGLAHQVVRVVPSGDKVNVYTACSKDDYYILTPERVGEVNPAAVNCGHCRRAPAFRAAGGPVPEPYKRQRR